MPRMLLPGWRRWIGLGGDVGPRGWVKAVREASQAGAGRSVAKLKSLLRGLPGLRLEYAEVVEGQLYAAVYLGKIRLIDHRPCRRKS